MMSHVCRFAFYKAWAAGHLICTMYSVHVDKEAPDQGNQAISLS